MPIAQLADTAAAATTAAAASLPAHATSEALASARLGAAVHLVQFETRVESPLPGGLNAFVRWFFGLPEWALQIVFGGGILLGLAAAVFLWTRRRLIANWLRTRQRTVQLALAGAAGVAVLGAAGAGLYGYHWMENDNGFCTGCHNPQSFEQTAILRLLQQEVHDTLRCHDCHVTTMAAQVKELWMWVTDRPEKIPPHAKVEDIRCMTCHAQGPGLRDKWKQVINTAGHKLHLDSLVGTPRAKSERQCVQCHGVQVHRFVPIDSTCSQQGCHLTEKVEINLGKMASQTDLHCVMCHEFTAAVPAVASRDSAASVLVPGDRNCMGCHQMRERFADFDPSKDPHGGKCGTCHNPHTQVEPQDAIKSCTTAGCHSNWRDTPFHIGKAHVAVGQRCEACHDAHASRVDPADCTGCHASAKARAAKAERRRPPPPQRFDTLRAIQRQTAVPPPREPRQKGDAPPPEEPPTAASFLGAGARADTFEHARHKALQCITCHDVASRRSSLTFAAPRGCLACHHQDPTDTGCAQCHQADEVRAFSHTERMPIRVAAKDAPRRERPVTFRHETHASARCLECHAAPVTLAPRPEARSCQDCHESHHEARTDCASCHRAQTTWDGHTRASHVECSACHAAATVARLTPTRSFCLACHAAETDHYAVKECTQCHMLASPEQVRPQLSRAP